MQKTLKIHENEDKVTIGDEKIHFNKKEFKLLKFLFDNKNKLKTKKDIFSNVWDKPNKKIKDNTIKTHIFFLRRKIEDSDLRIETIHRVGYRLVEK